MGIQSPHDCFEIEYERYFGSKYFGTVLWNDINNCAIQTFATCEYSNFKRNKSFATCVVLLNIAQAVARRSVWFDEIREQTFCILQVESSSHNRNVCHHSCSVFVCVSNTQGE